MNTSQIVTIFSIVSLLVVFYIIYKLNKNDEILKNEIERLNSNINDINNVILLNNKKNSIDKNINLNLNEKTEISSLKEDYDKYVKKNYNELTDLEPLSENLKNEIDGIGKLNDNTEDSLDFKIEFESKTKTDKQENITSVDSNLEFEQEINNHNNQDDSEDNKLENDNNNQVDDDNNQVDDDDDNNVDDDDNNNNVDDDDNNQDDSEDNKLENDEDNDGYILESIDTPKQFFVEEIKLDNDLDVDEIKPQQLPENDDKDNDEILISFKDNTDNQEPSVLSNIQMIDNNKSLDVENIINKEMNNILSEKKKDTNHNKIFGNKNLNDINNMTIKELQNIARENKLKVTGKKDVLVERVKALYNLHNNMHP